MNLQRLNEIYGNNQIANNNEIESLRQLTKDYPYFKKPFVILAKHYFETNHYKFEDMLKEAAMRVNDRKALYEYIHGKDQKDILNSEIVEITNTKIDINNSGPSEVLKENTDIKLEIKPGIEDFLGVSERPIENKVEEVKELNEINKDLDDLSSLETVDSEKDIPEEFEFEGHYKQHEEVEPIKEQAVIGEELDTEFTFTKSFVVEEKIEEKSPDQESLKSLSELYTYPTYNLEQYQPDLTKVDSDLNGSENPKDFFSWLDSPKHIDETINPIEKKTSDSEITETLAPINKGLDIIEKFIATNPQISRPKREFFNPENMAKRSEVPDLEFVTETLANIYYEQGDMALAIKAYEKLSLQNPSKQAYFADLIEKIKKERK